MGYIYTPWGEVQRKYVWVWSSGSSGEPLEAVISVVTAGHGGIGVLDEVAEALLSPEARAYGDREGRYLWFEEDVAACIPLYEIAPARRAYARHCKSTEKDLMTEALQTLARWKPTYLKERGIQVAA